jgi:hypothetical protein
MKAKSGVWEGFLSVVAAVLVIVATCCVYTEVAEAGCAGATSCTNCVINIKGDACKSDSTNQPACNTNQEMCNSCTCGPPMDDQCKCH